MPMTTRILVAMTICTLGGMVARVLPESSLSEALRQFFRVAQPLCILWWAWVGYLNRRPHWTRESWTRFLFISLIPITAIVLVLTVSAGVDNGASWVGEGRSWLRFAWGAVGLIGILVGGGGAGYLLYTLSAKDATTPFDWPWRRQRAH